MNEIPRGLAAKHPVVSADQWQAARKALLESEKAMTRARDALAAERRALPWVRVEKDYVFDGSDGKQSLADLFEGRSQLVIYHFMFGPGWDRNDKVCRSCAFVADHFDGTLAHLAERDVTLKVVSRAPFAELEPFRRRMGWRFPWLSAFGSDFNYDFGVSFAKEDVARGEIFYNYQKADIPMEDLQGISVFYRDESGAIFHTYSAYGRGVEPVMTTYDFLDLVPKGRDEDGLDFTMAWVRFHDSYEQNPPALIEPLPVASCCG